MEFDIMEAGLQYLKKVDDIRACVRSLAKESSSKVNSLEELLASIGSEFADEEYFKAVTSDSKVFLNYFLGGLSDYSMRNKLFSFIAQIMDKITEIATLKTSVDNNLSNYKEILTLMKPLLGDQEKKKLGMLEKAVSIGVKTTQWYCSMETSLEIAQKVVDNLTFALNYLLKSR